MSPYNAIVSKVRFSRAEMPRVALLVETSREVGRSILRGVERYARLHGPWSLHLLPGDLAQQLPEVKSWGASGIIARIETPEVERSILESKLPFVALDLYKHQKCRGGKLQNASEVLVNSPLVGKVAAEHLIERQFENFAFVGEINDVLWSEDREKGFVDRIAQAGYTVHRYKSLKASKNWGADLNRLGHWLQNLPKPIGVMAANDVRGRQVIAVCQEYNIRVPEDIAVIGVDNDTLLCQLSTPPMSSVSLDSENGGYQAAAILDGLMSGALKGRQEYLVNPLHVISRQSTERFEIADPVVAEAMKYIWINPMAPLGVKDVAEEILVSRRVLEVRFKAVRGHSVLTEINQARLARVKQLLKETNMKIREIAEMCGFGTEGYLCRFFRRETGVTLGQYRKQQGAAKVLNTRK